MSGPTDPARDHIVTLIESTQVVGSPALRNWDRREPLNAQAFRRFFVRVTSGSLSRLADAPNTANGGDCLSGARLHCDLSLGGSDKGHHRQ